jgi:hypothetical protein
MPGINRGSPDRRKGGGHEGIAVTVVANFDDGAVIGIIMP